MLRIASHAAEEFLFVIGRVARRARDTAPHQQQHTRRHRGTPGPAGAARRRLAVYVYRRSYAIMDFIGIRS